MTEHLKEILFGGHIRQSSAESRTGESGEEYKNTKTTRGQDS